MALARPLGHHPGPGTGHSAQSGCCLDSPLQSPIFAQIQLQRWCWVLPNIQYKAQEKMGLVANTHLIIHLNINITQSRVNCQAQGQ